MDEVSAHLEGHDTQSLRADHSGICKFSDRDDPKYQTVLKVLQAWIEEYRSGIKQEKPETVSGTCQ